MLARARGLGVVLTVAGGKLRYEAPRGRLPPALIMALHEHKAELLELLTPKVLLVSGQEAWEEHLARRKRDGATTDEHRAACQASTGAAEYFYFRFPPPGDAAEERVSVVLAGSTADVTRETRWQADMARCWVAFLHSASLLLQAPEGERMALLTRYRREASRRYGAATGARMAQTMAGWIGATGAAQRTAKALKKAEGETP